MTALDDTAAYLILLSLPGMGPARARWLLSACSPTEAVEHVRVGRLPAELGRAPAGVTASLVRRWSASVCHLDGDALRAEVVASGAEIVEPGHEWWPFADDPEPPVVVFGQGDLSLLGRRPSVAVVGTRRCTTIGRELAHSLGTGLAEAGVVVVSGLASGIDGAVHGGVLAAGGDAVAVVGTGLDVVYPKANRALWQQVAEQGCLISEAVLGSKPERWRFPARNRLIAGLVDAVVVVESHLEGGSLLTVEEAADRGVPVLAVPGSVASPASAGTNRLLVDGCAPVCSVEDVLDAIGVASWPGANSTPDHLDVLSLGNGAVGNGALGDGAWGRDGSGDDALAPDVSPVGRAILGEVSAGSMHIDQLVSSCRAPVREVLAEVRRLESQGFVELDGSTVLRRSASTSSHYL